MIAAQLGVPSAVIVCFMMACITIMVIANIKSQGKK